MYPGDTWHNKVMHMPPNQVIAIYQRMKNRNQKPVKVRKEAEQKYFGEFSYANSMKLAKQNNVERIVDNG